MKTTKEKINGQDYEVHNATVADESQTIAVCRLCGNHTRRYVHEEGIVCVSCIRNYSTEKVVEMEAKHTPTPWYIWEHGTDTDPSCKIFAEKAGIVQTIGGNDEANAQFIVRACNNFDDLLEALKEYQQVIERAKDLLTGDSCNDIGIYDLDEIVKAAIAQAEKEG